MLRRRIICLAISVSAWAQGAIWPEQWYAHKRVSLSSIKVSDPALWEEFGLEAAEEASYGSFQVKGYRLKDPTGALAALQYLGSGQQLANYVLQVSGYKPTQKEMDILQVQLPRIDQSALPSLPSYLPVPGLIPASRRYVLGPVSLDRFEKRISPSLAAFSLGAEAQIASYHSPKGEVKLSIFSYPTPQMAREKSEEFSKIPDSRVKRTGPLVAVVISPPHPDEAERLLAKVNYQATITWNERVGIKPEENVAGFLLGVFKLIGILLVFTLLAGFGFAGFRIGMRKLRGESAEDAGMTTLGLGGR